MLISEDLLKSILSAGTKAGTSSRVKQIRKVSGGSINKAYQILTEKEKFFVKVNSKSHFPKMFEIEKNGLELLASKTSLQVPKVINTGYFEDNAFLIMEFVDSGESSKTFWESFGAGMARLHLNYESYFGLQYDNYIGSVKQPNSRCENWTDFFVERRLEYQAKRAFDHQLIDGKMIHDLERFYVKLERYFPIEPPSLLHGDLWSGNFLVGKKGEPTIIDPAVYYGHREMDLAMSHLFGGFEKAFYCAYHETYPLENQWEERIEICNLYPLLVHVNLFGPAYVSRVKSVLRRYL